MDLRAVPTNAYARDVEMSLSEYETLSTPPVLGISTTVSYWKRFSARGTKSFSGWKKRPSMLLWDRPYFQYRRRTFINCDCHLSMPDGGSSGGGRQHERPCLLLFAIENGHEVEGIRLWFKDGKVIKATAEKNEDFLLKTLDTDEGARRVGEFAFGTNDSITKFTKQILFDEKIGGSFHMALGASYPETGGQNVSGIHWDMICDMRQNGEVTVDGRLFYKNGKFVIPLE